MTIRVCIGSACHLKGSYTVAQELQQLIEAHHLGDTVSLKAVFCMGKCTGDVSVDVDGEIYSVAKNNANTFFHNTILPKLHSTPLEN